jgi:hypothetical protein
MPTIAGFKEIFLKKASMVGILSSVVDRHLFGENSSKIRFMAITAVNSRRASDR